jgi:hypothetical protein
MQTHSSWQWFRFAERHRPLSTEARLCDGAVFLRHQIGQPRVRRKWRPFSGARGELNEGYLDVTIRQTHVEAHSETQRRWVEYMFATSQAELRAPFHSTRSCNFRAANSCGSCARRSARHRPRAYSFFCTVSTTPSRMRRAGWRSSRTIWTSTAHPCSTADRRRAPPPPSRSMKLPSNSADDAWPFSKPRSRNRARNESI